MKFVLLGLVCLVSIHTWADGRSQPLKQLKMYVNQMRYSPVSGSGINFSSCQKHQKMYIHLYSSVVSGGHWAQKKLFFEMSTQANRLSHRSETLFPIRGEVVEQVLGENGQPQSFYTEDDEEGVLRKYPWRVYIKETKRSYNRRSRRGSDCVGESVQGPFVGIVEFDLNNFAFHSFQEAGREEGIPIYKASGYFTNSSAWARQRRF